MNRSIAAPAVINPTAAFGEGPLRNRRRRHGLPKTGVVTGMHLRLFPTVEAPSQARREVASLATRIDRDSLSNVSTVISELVTISVAHGASKLIELSLAVDDGKLEGALCDDGSGARAVDRARKLRDNSLVLQIVDGLAEEWGTGGNEIWFRMAVQPI